MKREPPADPYISRQAALATAELLWETLLLNDRRIDFSSQDNPDVSIILVSHNASRLLAQTLFNLSRQLKEESAAVETIVIDNASDRSTQRLLDRVDGAIMMRNPQNIGYGPACNQGAALARGRFLLFLNPDIDLMPGAVDALIAGFTLFDRVGIVGGRLVFPGGRLQEAGSFFRDDAQMTHPYLRGHDNASAPEALYAREVAYVSGALLMIERDLFHSLNGFDELFAPAYFEDTDLCVRAIQSGRRVVYQPRSVAIHFENATAPKRETVERLLDTNRKRFENRHRAWLFSSGAQPTGFMERDPDRFRFRVLYIDDQTPHIDKGAGLPRANSIVNAMANMGYLVTILPCYATDEEVADRYRDLDPRIEILEAGANQTLARLIGERPGYYDALWVSRPHNIRMTVETFMNAGIEPRNWVKGRVIFDTEAVFAARDAANDLTVGKRIDYTTLARSVSEEVGLCSFADLVVCVSASEEKILKVYGGQHSIRVLGHALRERASSSQHKDRNGILFVGPLDAVGTPNVDSIEWFLVEVWPKICSRLGTKARLTLVGHVTPEIRSRLQGDLIDIRGRLNNLDEMFDAHRVAIAPTRFAAGLPQKVHNSVANGLPIVVTPLLAAQLFWNEGEGFLSAAWQSPDKFADAVIRLHEDEGVWNKVRDAGLSRVRNELSEAAFARTIRDICEDRTVS